MRKFIAALSLVVGMSTGLFSMLGYAEETATTPDLVSICKADCPKAKTNDEAHQCAEKLGRLNKSFRKSKCYVENEKYEEIVEKAKDAKK